MSARSTSSSVAFRRPGADLFRWRRDGFGRSQKRPGREVVMNQVALVGNITDDPELRYTQSGAALANFTVAVSHRSKHNGEWQDVNDGFFRCTAWRSVAENAAQTLKKGMWVFVTGKLVQRSWWTTTATSARPSRSRSPTSDLIF